MDSKRIVDQDDFWSTIADKSSMPPREDNLNVRVLQGHPQPVNVTLDQIRDKSAHLRESTSAKVVAGDVPWVKFTYVDGEVVGTFHDSGGERRGAEFAPKSLMREMFRLAKEHFERVEKEART